MKIIITGTPGTGKTSVAKKVAERLKLPYISLNDLIFSRKKYKEFDEERESYVVDPDDIEKICEEIEKGVIEGHLSHYCKGDVIFVLRASPIKIKQRLMKRKYSMSKIRENMEAEAIDVILQEVMDLWESGYYGDVEVYEIDTSDKSIERVVTIILKILKDEEYAKNYTPGRVDWTQHILDGKI